MFGVIGMRCSIVSFASQHSLSPRVGLNTKNAFICLNVCDRGVCSCSLPNIYQMTSLVPSLIQSKTKVNCLCVLVFLSFPLTMGEVPGPCRHSITREHLMTLRHLMDNQFSSGCMITYTFIERKDLSKCCFVKAALPWILELLATHFKYSRGSINEGYVQSLRALILNIYSQKCVPQINEEVEDKPESFEVSFQQSPLEALRRALEVLSVYWELMTTMEGPVDWQCESEYTVAFVVSTEVPTNLPTVHFTTDRAEKYSMNASPRRLETDFYKLGFIITSICGGILIIFFLSYMFLQKIRRRHADHRPGAMIIFSRELQTTVLEA
ncbi:macrophage colony-stimulating factor 1b isoform X2 [Gadus chalcogrammus]|uniref:macrophage colony-stimulating factor 1b isoform X2 n=1 Tax=Gadus chalcogrammus TaxID=1042646 RepID=UPI0024C46669|nr:macrophage colony-stimulating factor 1b isoform X2 [Gadus chalcogrammus]